MECLFQRHWHTEVRRDGEQSLRAETVYHDTVRDLVVGMKIKMGNFLIQEAYVEQHRPVVPSEEEICMVQELLGIEAYFSSGSLINRALAPYGNPLMSLLFAETVKGVIQAESFIFNERGYQTADDYEQYWRNFYGGTCRYYSNLDRVEQDWYQHLGTTSRTGVLFSRFKEQTLYRDSAGQWQLQGTFSDSFHELAVSIVLNPDERTVVDISGCLLRCPDQVCREAAGLLQVLKGAKLEELSKKNIAGALGRNQGCVHVIDLAYDLAYTLTLLHGD